MPKSSCTLCSPEEHFCPAGLHPGPTVEGLVPPKAHELLLDIFKICSFRQAAGSSPAKPCVLACLNKGRWLVKEVLALLRGQPKENKGMRAVTFMVKASRNENGLLTSLKLGRSRREVGGAGVTHGAGPPRPEDGAACPGQTTHQLHGSIQDNSQEEGCHDQEQNLAHVTLSLPPAEVWETPEMTWLCFLHVPQASSTALGNLYLQDQSSRDVAAPSACQVLDYLVHLLVAD